VNWTPVCGLRFANSNVNSRIVMHVFRTRWAPIALVSLHRITSWCWRARPMTRRDRRVTRSTRCRPVHVSLVQFMCCKHTLSLIHTTDVDETKVDSFRLAKPDHGWRTWINYHPDMAMKTEPIGQPQPKFGGRRNKSTDRMRSRLMLDEPLQ